jgi:hypothetical protein
MMRTTLMIPDPVCKRAKALARSRKKTLSQVVTEALESKLSREENAVRETPPPYKVRPVALGKPHVDISDRDELEKAMGYTP